MKFSVGDQVVEKKSLHPYSSYNIYKVIGIMGEALLLTHYGFAYEGEVTPESCYEDKVGTKSWRTGIQRFQESELVSPEEALEEIHRLEALKDQLKRDFEAVQSQIKTKLDQAALLIKEAGTIAKTCDKEFRDLKRECVPLYEALVEGGWSHSTMKC